MASSLNHWNDIPHTILINIFHYLGLNDRRNAALCCKSWSHILDYPILWCTLCCQFDSETHPNFSMSVYCKGDKSLKVVTHCSSWLRNLTIIWDKKINENLECLINFFESLKDIETIPQLTKLTLITTEMGRLSEENELVHDLILSLSRFLRTQTQIVYFCSLWELPPIYVALLLIALGRNSAEHLRVLEITQVNDGLPFHRFPNTLQSSLPAFANLQNLLIPYEMLGEDSLKSLIDKCQLLKMLVISLNFRYILLIVQSLNVISDEAWKDVATRLPNLGVCFDLGHCVLHINFFRKIIPPSVPLIAVRAVFVPLPAKIIWYLHNFADQFRALELKCFGNDYYVYELISFCSNLTSLKLVGPLPISIIENFVKMIKRKQIGLKHLSLLFQVLSDEEENEVFRIKEKYKLLWRTNQCFLELHSQSYTRDYLDALYGSFFVKLYD